MDRKGNFREIIRYLIVGALTTAVSLGSYYLCVFLFLDPNDPFQLQIANIISWISAVTFAYFASRTYVFNSNNGNKIKEFISFYLARITTLLMDMSIMFIGVSLLHGNDKIVKLVVQVVVTVCNYIFSKVFVFRSKN